MPDFSYEDRVSGLVAGVDEVGRGPCAGPVTAAAVVLNRETIPDSLLDQLDDSKKISPGKRERIAESLLDYAWISIAEASVVEIDEINILQASLLAMKRAVEGLSVPIAQALIDGNKAPSLLVPAQTVVKGDSRSYSIAAASIVAKVDRDQLMHRLDAQYPEYSWANNAGYGTAAHLQALEQYGVTPHHRQSFAPVRRQLEKEAA